MPPRRMNQAKMKMPQQSVAPGLPLKSHNKWDKWNDLRIWLRDVPFSETTWNIWNNFSKYGSVSRIDLGDFRRENHFVTIIFSPPPKEPFWKHGPKPGHIMCTSGDGNNQYEVRIKVDLRDPRSVQSPIRRQVYYDEKMSLKATHLYFGITIEPASIMALAQSTTDVTWTVDLRRHKIVVSFSVEFKDPRRKRKNIKSQTQIGECDRINKYMFDIPLDQLKTIQKKTCSPTDDMLIVSLDSPPRFFRKREDEQIGHSAENTQWSQMDCWFRQTDIIYDPDCLKREKIALHKDMPDIDIGRWTTYILKVEKLTEIMKQALEDFNISVVDTDNLSLVEPKDADLWSLIDPSSNSEASADLSYLDSESGIPIPLPFEVRYQLEVCISRGILNEYNLTKEFVTKLANTAAQYPDKAQSILEYVAEQEVRIFEPMRIFDDPAILEYTAKIKVPHYCAYSRKATVTPTTVYFSSPTVETTNRVLRHYARENDDGRFLRVQFTDELHQGRINSSVDQQKNDEIYTRVYRTLFNGIQIGDRHYEFLAFGNSQFRENGAYFFCPTEHLSCSDIRQWMGSFSHISVVAKYAARVGQCFSTTRAIRGLSKPDIIIIPDIEKKVIHGSSTNTYCFTDGVGKISFFMAKLIAAEFGLRTVPSAFQYRLGGCKGILVVSLDAKDKQIHVRKSQQKFTAVYNGLEIIRCSRFSVASLNRQTITILSSLGVEDEVFLKMLSEQLEGYQSAMINDDVAVNLLLRYIDENQMTINIATMVRYGFMARKDPFVMSLLHLWRAWSIKLLKEKAKIIVEHAAFLFGCVDETGTLKGHTISTVLPGQKTKEEDLPEIFVQVPDKKDPSQYNIIEGICLIGRNPSLHPGDLRVVKAVNNPKLHHLRDVVVFPSTGDRDVPSMCSGGDLDGDDYFVIWDENLQPAEWNAEPMNYLAPIPKESRRPIEMHDVMKFFVRFMKNNTLSAIAHAHLAQSDYLENGVKDPICLELAALHSKAVDCVKTGEAAQMPSRLQPKKWPHFMEKKHLPSERQYHSTKILGKLYDRVETVSFVPQWEKPFDSRILRAYKLESSILKAARQVKSQYDVAMRKLLSQQEIGTEFEMWSTFILSKPRVGSDYKIQEEIARLSDGLKDQFRDLCIEKAGGKEFAILGPFVAAMYTVTKEELDVALVECHSIRVIGGQEFPVRKMEAKYMPLISFPWLFEKELGRIATGLDASNDFLDIGLGQLVLREPGRKRQNGAALDNLDNDDVIRQENGLLVHRGEELDLFRDHSEDPYFASGSEDAITQGENSSIMGANGKTVVTTDFETSEKGNDDLLLSTGIEDVVPQRPLDRLVNRGVAVGAPYDLEGGEPSGLLDWRLQRAEHPVTISGAESSSTDKKSAGEFYTAGLSQPPSTTLDTKKSEPEVVEPVEEEVVVLLTKDTALDRLFAMHGE